VFSIYCIPTCTVYAFVGSCKSSTVLLYLFYFEVLAKLYHFYEQKTGDDYNDVLTAEV